MSQQASASFPLRPYASFRINWPTWARERPELLLAPALFVAVLAFFEVAVGTGLINKFLIPAPSDVFISLVSGISSGLFFEHGWVTAAQAGIGFGIAVAAGIVIGTLVAEFEVVERVVYPYLVAIQTMPKIALAPLLIVWFGFGMPSKIAVAAVISFFPVLVNTIAGMRNVDQGRLDVLRALGASRWRMFSAVKLPSSLPYVFAGVNVAIVFALTGTIVGEFVGASAGLGFLIVQANTRMDVPEMFAILAVLSLIGVGAYSAIQTLRRRLLFWAPQEEVNRT